ncbi:trypsin-like serine peptidase [Rhodovibrionaceae bacterium A322]
MYLVFVFLVVSISSGGLRPALAQSPSPAEPQNPAAPLPITQSRAFDRVIPDNRFWPWAAVGRLNQAGYKSRHHCTAVLVRPTVALTAAHCLQSNIKSGQHFLPGYRGGSFLEHRRVADSRVFDAWQDLALISFADASGQTPLVLAKDLKIGDEVVLAGYNGKDRHRLSLGRGCRIVALEPDTQNLLHNCQAGQGDSGAPVLKVIRGEDGALDYRLAAIHYGVINAPQEPGKHGLGVANNLMTFKGLP